MYKDPRLDLLLLQRFTVLVAGLSRMLLVAVKLNAWCIGLGGISLASTATVRCLINATTHLNQSVKSHEHRLVIELVVRNIIILFVVVNLPEATSVNHSNPLNFKL